MTEQSPKQWRRAKVKINLDALSSNLGKVREYAANSQIMAVIKADAYGHGMLSAAKVLIDADMFAVAMPEEAYALRSDGCTKPIIVLHGFSNVTELQAFSELGISSVVHQQFQLDCLLEAKLASAIDCWLKIDTGMHRLGIQVDEVDAYYAQLSMCFNVADVFLMTHFSHSDVTVNINNYNQLSSFINVINNVDVSCSMANSAAIMRLPKSHFDVVRPGIMLYGASPFKDVTAAELGLQPVMQFESMLIDIKVVKAGESIGYSSTFTCDKDITVGVVAAGYGDGYSRHAKSGTPVWLNDKCCDLIGRVSMDSLCIDLTGVDAKIGDRVVLWGDELSVDEVARSCDSIAYELLCSAGAAHSANR
ncbi:MAG: alanine racemase [Gammaproteobacteria bacterium]|nr:alanine racemase [Gammaproteobacteria bacterium]